MQTLKLLWEAIKLTTFAVIACALAGYLLSYPAAFIFHKEAILFKLRWGVYTIATSQLDALDTMIGIFTFTGAIIGLFSAQTTFLAQYFTPPNQP